MMDVKLPSAIFFDWDGTLVDSFDFLEAAHNHVLKLLEMPEKEKGWFHPYFGKPREFIYVSIYGAKAAEAQLQFEIFVSANHTKLVKPAPGAFELLSALAEQGIIMGVVTNKKGDFVRGEIAAFDWDNFFISVVGAGEAEKDKPSAAPLRLAVEKARCTNEEIWYVGDTEADFLCARDYGCPAILIHPNYKLLEWLGNYTPLHITSNCKAFKEFLLQIS